MWLFFALTANALWSQSDILYSAIVRHHSKSSFFLTAISSFFELCVLLVIVFFAGVHLGSAHSWLLLLGGVCGYGGFLFYFWVIDRVDASVMSISWAFTNIFVALGAFLFLGDRFTVFGLVGLVVVLSGAFLLSFWHHHVSMLRTVLILIVLGCLYVPFFLTQKVALLAGDLPMVVLFWSILGQKATAFIAPVVLPKQRQEFFQLMCGRASWSFFVFVIASAFFSIVGHVVSIIAYSLAPASLVSVTLNTQPFMVIILAWVWSRCFPRSAPRELLTTQSVSVKIISFSLVFLGLALLGISQ